MYARAYHSRFGLCIPPDFSQKAPMRRQHAKERHSSSAWQLKAIISPKEWDEQTRVWHIWHAGIRFLHLARGVEFRQSLQSVYVGPAITPVNV